ncbi:MAG: phosphatase PAP2 family protein [Thermoleophilia bacterium]|nr:phosphatase PAP2 family protein [Thermoleophilia bacterium]
MLDRLADVDRAVFEAVQALHWQPLTVLFVVASAWWLKGLAFTFAAAWLDARAGRTIPVAALAVTACALAADGVAVGLKHTFDRERPAHNLAGFDPLGATPDSPSLPSGHAASAFAAAVLLAVLYPRLRAPALAVAALVALSRIYLGVHFPADVALGAAVGTAVGLGTAVVLATRLTGRLGAAQAT